ncbi:MAG: hypothetical protein LBF09_02630 [Odoribacteraceae bacterium]|nr:hypothetical protein [Odoribacteraceae bacterium]
MTGGRDERKSSFRQGDNRREEYLQLLQVLLPPVASLTEATSSVLQVSLVTSGQLNARPCYGLEGVQGETIFPLPCQVASSFNSCPC